MSGFIDNGLPTIPVAAGDELLNVDTQNLYGENPASGGFNVLDLALLMKQLSETADKVPVAGTRYYRSVNIGIAQQFTGIAVLVGSVGGTDKFILELHSPTGALLATTALAGVTVGTAALWQKIPFTTPYLVTTPGTYFLAAQLNGTTARLAVLHNPALPVYTGSATGVFGTGAAITPPTTYTVDLGPAAVLYQ